MFSNLKYLFNNGIESVKPSNIVNSLSFENRKLICKDVDIQITDNIYIIGFGKAALGFLNPLSDKIGSKLSRAIFSIPTPTEHELTNNSQLFCVPDYLKSKTTLYYGSRSNQPNSEVIKASSAIYELIQSLTANDTLIVVITGGGSALLCKPVDNVTVEDIVLVSGLLSKAGASILELNTVRRCLDILKGGGLALLSKSFVTIGLILSDVIGDDVSMIASGPTVIDNSKCHLSPLDILDRFNCYSKVPPKLIDVLKLSAATNNRKCDDTCQINVHNAVLGSNEIALNSISNAAEKLNMIPFILTRQLDGDCVMRAREIVAFLEVLVQYRGSRKECNKHQLEEMIKQLSFDETVTVKLLETIEHSSSKQTICLLLGGETPVVVGESRPTTGLGGRCTHMALTMALLIHGSVLKTSSMSMLFGASDGMDGATDCAGAIIYPNLVDASRQAGMDPLEYLDNYDTYNFFAQFDGGSCFLKTGMTGTNVMDLIIIAIDNNL